MTTIEQDYFNSSVLGDFWRTFAGAKLGGGMSREVFACNVRDDLVIKVENGSGMFQNVIEWETWQVVRYLPIGKWFAPCETISPCGTVLLQKRTSPATRFPDKMPAFLCDFKRTNYGMIGRQLVCHDYGLPQMIETGATRRMRKVAWADSKS